MFFGGEQQGGELLRTEKVINGKVNCYSQETRRGLPETDPFYNSAGCGEKRKNGEGGQKKETNATKKKGKFVSRVIAKVKKKNMLGALNQKGHRNALTQVLRGELAEVFGSSPQKGPKTYRVVLTMTKLLSGGGLGD